MNENKNKIDLIKEVMLDDKLVRKVCCPGCGVWGIIDDDQFFGRVSILCDCGFHETINLAELWPKLNRPIEFTKLTIKSNGTSRNTQILTDDGKILFGVMNVFIYVGLDDEVTAIVTLIQPKLELKNVKAEITKEKI